MEFKTTFDQRFDPQNGSVIYHYSTEFVLKSICKNQELWLSDIYSMNDSSEFEWGRQLFVDVLKNNKNEFDQRFRFFIICSVMSAVPNTLPAIASFSKNGDLLSQWRAYAEDGMGYSIGFDSGAIYEGLGVNINSVVYDVKEQYNLVLSTLRGLHAMWKTKEENFETIQIPSQIFAIDLAYFKNPTFFEEQEVRIIRLLVGENEYFRDVGGNSEFNQSKPLQVLTRRKDEDIIKYVKLPIKFKDSHIIKEIIIGPKNKKPIEEVEKQLFGLGLRGISIKRSKSTYR